MSRAVLVYLQLIIPIEPVFSQRGQSLFAPGRVEPAFGEDELGGVDSGLLPWREAHVRVSCPPWSASQAL